MGPLVLKFGGTSVQDEQALRRLVGIVAGVRGRQVVVVSALAGVTNALAELARTSSPRARVAGLTMLLDRHVALAGVAADGALQGAALDHLAAIFRGAAALVDHPGELDAGGRDGLLAVGELASSRLVAAVLGTAGLDASWVDARRAVVTDGRFGAARPLRQGTREAVSREVGPHLAAGRVPVLGGFVGATAAGETTTLGRGGSDYTAGIVGAAVDAARVEIWTDVDGILSADPRVVPHASVVRRMSGVEAYDLARFGARVLHAGTLEPVAEPGITVSVRNSRRPELPGTEIGDARGDRPAVAGIAHRASVTLVDLVARDLGASSEFLELIAACVDHGANQSVTPVAVSPQRALVACDDPEAAIRVGARARRVADVRSIEDADLVAVVGQCVQTQPFAWKALEALGDRRAARRVVQSSSGCALVVVTPPGAAEALVRDLHDCLFAASREMEVA